MQMAFAYTGTTLMPPLFGQLFARISFSLMPYVLLGCAAGVYLCTTRLAAARTRLNLTNRHVS